MRNADKRDVKMKSLKRPRRTAKDIFIIVSISLLSRNMVAVEDLYFYFDYVCWVTNNISFIEYL